MLTGVNHNYVKIKLEAGKTYYIRCYVKGGWINKAEMVQVDEATAKKEMKNLKPVD